MKNMLANFEDDTAAVDFCLVTSSGMARKDKQRFVTKQNSLNGRRVVFKVYIVLSFRSLTADWRRWQGEF